MSIAKKRWPKAAELLLAIGANPVPGRDLLAAVRAGFIVQGTTLPQWCRSNDVSPDHARTVLLSDITGEKTVALRRRLIAGAGLDATS